MVSSLVIICGYQSDIVKRNYTREVTVTSRGFPWTGQIDISAEASSIPEDRGPDAPLYSDNATLERRRRNYKASL
jgi:hypothetical protein